MFQKRFPDKATNISSIDIPFKNVHPTKLNTNSLAQEFVLFATFLGHTLLRLKQTLNS